MTTTQTQPFEIRRAEARGRTEIGWLHSQHSFSFGQYQDPERMGYRALRVINDDIVEPGQGFGEHGHRDMEIVTWVLSGGLKHGDSLGNMQVLSPGELQAMTAGTGIQHSEFNASDTERVHFLQVWLLPRERGVQPRYLQDEFDAAGRANQWQALATDATLRVADLAAGKSIDVDVAEGKHAYVHVVTGNVDVAGKSLQAGDALVTDQSGQLTFTASGDAQLLWFELD